MPTPSPEDWRERWDEIRKDHQGQVIVPTLDAIIAELDKLDAIVQQRHEADRVNRDDPRR